MSKLFNSGAEATHQIKYIKRKSIHYRLGFTELFIMYWVLGTIAVGMMEGKTTLPVVISTVGIAIACLITYLIKRPKSTDPVRITMGLYEAATGDFKEHRITVGHGYYRYLSNGAWVSIHPLPAGGPKLSTVVIRSVPIPVPKRPQ